MENWKSRAPKKISNISRAGLLFYPSRGKSLPTAILKIFRHNASIYTNFNQIDRALRLSSNSIRITRSTKILCIPAVRDTYSSVCAFVFFDFVFVRFPLIKSFFFSVRRELNYSVGGHFEFSGSVANRRRDL